MSVNNDISLRIKRVIEELFKGNQSEFARHVGISEAGVRSYLSGTLPKADILQKILASTAISCEWLVMGEGEMMCSKSKNYKNEQNREFRAIYNNVIPLIPMYAVTEFGIGKASQKTKNECEKYVIPNFREAEFLVQIKGNSMYPRLSSGDIVACKTLKLDAFIQWNKVYVVGSAQEVLIKRVKKGRDKNHIQLVSENQNYDPFEIPRKDIISLAIVLGVIRHE